METWGLKPGQVGGPPADCKVWWGARAIYNGAREKYQVDLLWDRQSMTGDVEKDAKERTALFDWINKKGLKGLRRQVKEEAVYPGDNILITFEEGGYIINANPNRSHGYLYICAYKKP